MGRATRWLRALFGGKKADPDESPADGRPAARGRRRWGFVMQFLEKGQPPQRRGERTPGSYREAQRPFAAATAVGEEEDEEEQNKRAIAVAAATAAVAEAAVAAAQAAAAVVRLTSSGRAPVGFAPAAAASKQEAAAAIKIQSAFRGYLARRALKALKGLVKLQALVRGNIVRKQAAETLRCMQALVRVQARARACRVLRSERCRFEKAPSGHARIPSTSGSRDRANSGGWNWLDRWMEERYWDGRESVKKPGSSGGGCAPVDDEKSAKILEVDPGKPQFHHHKRRNAHNHSSCSTLTSDQNSHSFVTVPDSPSTESTAAQQLRLAAAAATAAEYSESPQFYSASSTRPGSSRRGPFTPNSKSECSRSLFSGYCDYPNYMANTESSRAKVRSHSAPKQRPADRPNALPPPGAAPLAQRSSSLHAKFSNKAYPGSGRLDRLGMPIRI